MSIEFNNNDNFLGSSKLVMLEGNHSHGFLGMNMPPPQMSRVMPRRTMLTKVAPPPVRRMAPPPPPVIVRRPPIVQRKNYYLSPPPQVRTAVYEDIPDYGFPPMENPYLVPMEQPEIYEENITTDEYRTIDDSAAAQTMEGFLGCFYGEDVLGRRNSGELNFGKKFAKALEDYGGENSDDAWAMAVQEAQDRKNISETNRYMDSFNRSMAMNPNDYDRGSRGRKGHLRGDEEKLTVSPDVMKYIKNYVDERLKKTPIAQSFPQLVFCIRPYLRKQLVDEGGFLSGDEFDSLNGEQLHGLFSFIGNAIKGIGKGIGKVAGGIVRGVGSVAKTIGKAGLSVVKGIGKGIGTVASTVGKGLLEAGKFAVKNLPGIIGVAASILPGGGLISEGINAVTGLLSPGGDEQPPQDNGQQQQAPQELQAPPQMQFQMSNTMPRVAPSGDEQKTREMMQKQQRNNSNGGGGTMVNYPTPPNYYSQQAPQYYNAPQYYDASQYYDAQQEYSYPTEYYYPQEQLPPLNYQDQQMLGNIFDDVWGKIKEAGSYLLNPTNQRGIANRLNTVSDAQTMLQQGFKNADTLANFEQKTKEAQYNLTTTSESVLSTWGIPLMIGGLALIILMRKN